MNIQIPLHKMSFSDQFRGKTAIVTGAGRGVGKVIATKLHELGATVYAVSKNPENLKSLKAQCPNVQTVAVDLGNWAATRETLERLPVADYLVNNAGIARPGTFQETTEADLDILCNVNIKAVVNVSQIFVKKLVAAGKPGSIVNVSSAAGLRASPMASAYSMVKGGLDHLTRNMAVELAPLDIRVNSVNPGPMATDLLKGMQESMKNADAADLEMAINRIPAKYKMVEINDVVNSILFLLSDAAFSVIGNFVAVDGGYSVT